MISDDVLRRLKPALVKLYSETLLIPIDKDVHMDVNTVVIAYLDLNKEVTLLLGTLDKIKHITTLKFSKVGRLYPNAYKHILKIQELVDKITTFDQMA